MPSKLINSLLLTLLIFASGCSLAQQRNVDEEEPDKIRNFLRVFLPSQQIRTGWSDGWEEEREITGVLSLAWDQQRRKGEHRKAETQQIAAAWLNLQEIRRDGGNPHVAAEEGRKEGVPGLRLEALEDWAIQLKRLQDASLHLRRHRGQLLQHYGLPQKREKSDLPEDKAGREQMIITTFIFHSSVILLTSHLFLKHEQATTQAPQL